MVTETQEKQEKEVRYWYGLEGEAPTLASASEIQRQMYADGQNYLVLSEPEARIAAESGSTPQWHLATQRGFRLKPEPENARGKDSKRKPVSITMPILMLDAVDALKRKLGKSRTDIVMQALIPLLKEHGMGDFNGVVSQRGNSLS